MSRLEEALFTLMEEIVVIKTELDGVKEMLGTNEPATEGITVEPVFSEPPINIFGTPEQEPLVEITTEITRDKLIKAKELKEDPIGYSQRQIAELAHLSTTVVSKALSGHYDAKYGI